MCREVRESGDTLYAVGARLPGAASLCRISRFTAELWQAAQLQPRGINLRKEIETKQKQSLAIYLRVL